ncbi:acyltransferase domain-containing protein [Streptomyces kaniharaensis]|uniref:Acyltransferase domain-containing protein n=1 Tax=Streptomyces kaniharaensis TaxID=212423 RepID=A0A6N7KZ93_9ACTN|nr:acyltransferase domain-containing protein [Streptomyces kaniharaensis]
MAVVGLDCAFPGAADPEAFWDVLMRGADAAGAASGTRWDRADHPDLAPAGLMADADAFDDEFFSIAPREAAAMDPHHRLLLQCAWRAIEDAGVSPAALAGTGTGVYVGAMGGEWGRLTLADPDRIRPQDGSGSSAAMTANRISYHLNLTGPSMAVDTACSSSLVAVHLAAGALLAGECDTALAGGVNLVLSPVLGLVYDRLGVGSPDGRCRPFSADADGIGRSDGVGVVVLRRLADAVADGQRVYAVIRGSAVSHDGRSNGVTAPNRWSQQKVLENAYRRAGVTPDRVAFVEAHGTGTLLGDAIECAALGTVHGVARPEPCAIGSVKGNIGHTEGAAGIAGLIKAALALHHRVVPASRHADRENRQLRLADRGLRLLKSPLRLPPGESLAGVSSFGMGGTNAHVVLASAPRVRPARPQRGRRARWDGGVFTVTADTPEALRRNLVEQEAALARRPHGPAAALCRLSNRTKTGLPYRFAVAAGDTTELAGELRRVLGTAGESGERPWGAPVVAFAFTGQGSQFAGMTAELYRDSARYRAHLDEADAALAPHVGVSVRDLIVEGADDLRDTGLAQPALFAVGYALARTLTDLGIRPAAVLGHSVGEIAAAVIAGALELPDAARLVAARGALLREQPAGGGMLAVGAGRERVAELLAAEPQVALGAVNGPGDTVLSGPVEVLERIEAVLAGEGVRTRMLEVSHAFHTPLSAESEARFRAAIRQLPAGAPAMPFASTYRGRMISDDPSDALDADYWTGQAARPVLFSDALAALVGSAAPTHLMEIGPRAQLLPLVGRAGLPDTPCLLHPGPGGRSGGRELAGVIAELYRAGLDPQWEALYEPGRPLADRLPPYRFATAHRYWARWEPVRTPAGPERAVERPPAPAELERSRVEPDAVLATVIDAIVQVGGYAEDVVRPQARFYEDLAFDSVMIVQLKVQLETRLPALGELSVHHLLPALRSIDSLAQCLRELLLVTAA